MEDWTPETPQGDINKIVNPFTMEELEAAFKQMKDLKAPGMNGMPALPFKLLPKQGHKNLLAKFNELLETGMIPEEWKQGEIITLFKKGDILEIGNRRPITLLQTEYKILSKLITNRLNLLMPSLIHEDQVGFIPERIIFDNVLVAHEVLQREEKYAISVDFEKAYDSISHDAIYMVLQHLKFPEQFINLVRGMIAGSKARIRNGEHYSEFFDVLRGVKQGCPLSPLLFALVIEPLANRIRKHSIGASLGNIFQAIILYADDIFLFAANPEDQLKQIEILDNFYLATGLKMNKQKSLHISSHDNELNIPVCPETGFKYLGFWMNKLGLMDKTDDIMNKICDAVERWKYFSWNTRQKASVLQTYIMSKIWFYSFILNMENAIPRLVKLRKEFLWQNSFNGKTTQRTKQSQIRSEVSRANGGLGLSNLSARFQAQHAWIINMCFVKSNKIKNIWRELYGLDKNNLESTKGSPHKLYLGYLNSYKKLPLDERPNGPNGSMLKDWTLSLSGKEEEVPIRTKRQERLLKDLDVDLIKMFLNVKKRIKDVTIRDFCWNLSNGTLYYKRGGKCPCGAVRNTEHILFSCNRLNNINQWYSPQLKNEAIAATWTEKDVFKTIQTSKSSLTIALYVCLLKAIWLNKDCPSPTNRIFKETLQDTMLSEWFFAKYHPDYNFIPENIMTRFETSWGPLTKMSKSNIPILKDW